jgi:UDP-glucose 4-epimerase
VLKGSRVLVVGGSGFVGAHLVNKLIKHGCGQIIVFDKFIRPEKFQPSDRLEMNQGEISDTSMLRRAMRNVDYVFHLAVLPLSACIENPRACVEINVNGTFNILEAARDSGVKKLVFSSASSVYGDTDQTMDESHPLDARTMYGASKIAGEYFLRAFYDMYKLNYVILRYMNVYGPGQEGGLIISVLKRIKSGLPPIIVGDGSQSFDFVYIEDIVSANILAMESKITNETFNIGGEEEASVKDVVYTLLEITGSNLTAEFKLGEKVTMQRRVGSSQKALRLIGYAPRVHLKEGLKIVVKDYLEP